MNENESKAGETMFDSLRTKIENIARVAHEANRAYCKTLGDNSQLAWQDAPEWQRVSTRDGVLFVLTNPASTPRDAHQNWLMKKIDDGWTYGEVKDADKKTHPCLVPYDMLPEEVRRKDALFIAVVRALAL